MTDWFPFINNEAVSIIHTWNINFTLFISYSCMQACMCACVCSKTQQGSTYLFRQGPNHSRPLRCWQWWERCHEGLQSGCRWAQWGCTIGSGAPSGCRTPCSRWRTQSRTMRGRLRQYCLSRPLMVRLCVRHLLHGVRQPDGAPEPIVQPHWAHLQPDWSPSWQRSHHCQQRSGREWFGPCRKR